VGAVLENTGVKSGERPQTCLTVLGDIPDSDPTRKLVKLDLAWLCSTLSKLELEGLRYRSTA